MFNSIRIHHCNGRISGPIAFCRVQHIPQWTPCSTQPTNHLLTKYFNEQISKQNAQYKYKHNQKMLTKDLNEDENTIVIVRGSINMGKDEDDDIVKDLSVER